MILFPMKPFESLCVFCGSSNGSLPAYRAAARSLGAEIARRGWKLVYGGAHVGLMGAVAGSTLAAGGQVTGVIPEDLVARELAHPGLHKLHRVKTMHERKALMADLADGFVAMPGGYGTLDELFEILTWAQLGIHAKPIGLLNLEGFFDPLLTYLDHAVDHAFLKKENRDMFLVDSNIGRLLDRLPAFHPKPVKKWIGPEER